MNGKFFPTLAEGIKYSFSAFADLPCLDVGGKTYTFAEIGEECAIVANHLAASNETNKFVGIFAYRSRSAYTGIYGTLLAGKAYVPLNPRFPAERLKQIIKLANLQIIILSEESVASFSAFAGEIESLAVICFLEEKIVEKISGDFPQHHFISLKKSGATVKFPAVAVAPVDLAYLMFTSGSTGIPKGVAVTHENVCAYANYTIAHYGVSTSDRFSQMPDITFDLSVHDLFVSILAGACLCVAPEKQLMAPAKFIKDKAITFWTSVPSVVMFLDRFGMLKPNNFPSVRRTMFCGEALPAQSAEQWQKAAPNSLVENTYGPTEATVAITNYAWNSETSPAECQNGIVPLGKIFATQKVRLVDENQKVVKLNEIGEICLSGSQITAGYFNDAEKTAERFVRFADAPQIIWYKTGDLGFQDENGILYYSGRIDEQVKIRGYRVELHEVDRVLREFAGTDLAVSAIKKSGTSGAAILIGFVQGEENDAIKNRIFQGCRQLLPEYMIPSEIRFIDELPLNQNGKINRKMLSFE